MHYDVCPTSSRQTVVGHNYDAILAGPAESHAVWTTGLRAKTITKCLFREVACVANKIIIIHLHRIKQSDWSIAMQVFHPYYSTHARAWYKLKTCQLISTEVLGNLNVKNRHFWCMREILRSK